MSEPTLDDLRVMRTVETRDKYGEEPLVRPPVLAPNEAPCTDCAGTGLYAGHGHRPHPNDDGERHDCSSCPYPCDACHGTGQWPPRTSTAR